MRRTIKVEALEFDEGSHTIWVQGTAGTVMRIKLPMGTKIETSSCGGPGPSHFDLTIEKLWDDHPVVVCLGDDLI